MVNNGVSRACHACKQRRKKCDERRPSCLRCSRARRTCPGYEPKKDLKFINYSGKVDLSVLDQPSSKLLSQPASFYQTETIDWFHIENSARLLFFNDYCIISSNRSMSRGYLHGLQAMIAKADPNSELVQACTLAALANLGNKSGNLMHKQRAESLYSSLLRSFRLSISNEAVFTTVESLITAALLGLYEIISSTGTYLAAHVAHAQGISAILISKFSPFDLLCDGKLFQVANPIPLEDLEVEIFAPSSVDHSAGVITKASQKFSVLCTPLFNQSSSTIDFIYARTMTLMRKAECLLDSKAEATVDELCKLKFEAEQLREEYHWWPKTVPQEWLPTSLGIISPGNEETLPDVGYWPAPILCYYDCYVASLWNNYRKACLLVLSVIIQCHHRINGHSSDQIFEASIQKDVKKLTENIVSSIPFLLTADLQEFAVKSTQGSPPIVPGRPVGGLLTMHALFILSTLSIVEEKLQIYMRSCLAWIGTNMGIGQATVLSKYTAMNQFQYAREARVIIWTGMLI
ncbi:hypothetical protein V8C35DRAFT_316916 [Trichoderma chlorosporum]